MIVESDHQSLYQQLGGHEGIRKFIGPFYADIRQHQVLGPIFMSRIDNWDEHLDKITEFWALQTGGPSEYRGGFAGAHIRASIKPEHFNHWLELWEFNCKKNLAQDLHAPMIALAHEFGRRLKNVLSQVGHR